MSPHSNPARPLRLLQLLAWLAAVSVVKCVDQRSCTFTSVAEGWLPVESPASVLHGMTSHLQCARACMTSQGSPCLSLGYSQEQKECRLYFFLTSSNLTVASPGHQYYTGCPAGLGERCVGAGDCGTDNAQCLQETCQCGPGFRRHPDSPTCLAIRMGDSCSTSGDCKNTANAECRYGTCQCVIGYHFYPGPATCVATCPAGYGNGYYKVSGVVMAGHDKNVSTLGSEAACYSLCSQDARCRSFDWDQDSGLCYTQEVTLLEDPQALVSDSRYAYGQMNCA